MASQTGSLSLKMNRLTCHHRGPGWAARDEQLLLQRNHQPTLSTAHAGAPCTRCTPQLALCTVTYCTHEFSGSQGLTCCDDSSSPSLPSSEACKLPRKKKKQTATAERASALNTVPIFQVCQRMHFDPGLDVHARLANLYGRCVEPVVRFLGYLINPLTQLDIMDRDLHIHLDSTAQCLVSVTLSASDGEFGDTRVDHSLWFRISTWNGMAKQI